MFDFRLEWEWERTPPDQLSPDGGAAGDAADRSIISSIHKQLGLQLNAGKGPREFFIIDHVERPSGN